MRQKKVEVHLYSQSEPCRFENVRNAYTKDRLYCVWALTPEVVYKFPVEHIFRIKEWYEEAALEEPRGR